MTKFFSRWAGARAAVRVARRDIGRHRGRSALIAVMIAVPVMAVGAVSVIYHSDQEDPSDVVRTTLGDQAQAEITYGEYGSVQLSRNGHSHTYVEPSSTPPLADPARIAALLRSRIPDQDRLVMDVNRWTSTSVRLGNRRLSVVVREIDYTATGLGGLIKQQSGRSPSAPNEVVVSQQAARRENIKVGDSLAYTPVRNRPSRALTVVGVVGGANLNATRSIIGVPGALFGTDTGVIEDQDNSIETTWLVTGPKPIDWQQVRAFNQVGASVISREVVLNPPPKDRIADARAHFSGPGDGTAIGIFAVIIGLVLLQIALLAGPAIAVGARRHQRGLAIMASAGAERRHLRTVVLATNGLIGLGAGLIGGGLGGALGAGIAWWLIHTGRQSFARVDVHLLDLLALAVVGGLTAVAASLIPARQAARLDVVAVLTGRRALLPPRRRVSVVGLLLVWIGAVSAYWFSGHRSQFSSVAALAVTEIGVITATGAVLALVARVAVRAPLPLRFALRDAARQRSRTVPAVAAVLAAIAGATCALVYLASNTQMERSHYVAEAPYGTSRIVLSSGFTAADPADVAEVESATRRVFPIAELRPYQALFENGSGKYAWLSPMPSSDLGCAEVMRLGSVSNPSCVGGGGAWRGPSRVFDDGSAYPLLTGRSDPAGVVALRAGRVVVGDPNLIWSDGMVHVQVGQGEESDTDTQTDRTVVLPATLITAAVTQEPIYPLSAVSKLGVNVAVQGLVATTTRMPTEAEEDQLRSLVTPVGGQLWVERGYQADTAIVLLSLVAAALVIALAGTFTAVGLAVAESRADLATLAAVGASPGVRRRLAASQAGVIAGLGSVLGVLSGVLAGWILVRLQVNNFDQMAGYSDLPLSGWTLALPGWHLLALGVGVPLLAVAVGYGTTRSRLPLIRRTGQ